MEKAFSPHPSELQLNADSQEWHVREETALAYYLEKIALLRQAYPDQTDKCLLVKVRMGLPADLQRDVRQELQSQRHPPFIIYSVTVRLSAHELSTRKRE